MLGTALALAALAVPATTHGTRTCAERAEPSAPDAATIAAPVRFFATHDGRIPRDLKPRDGRYAFQKLPVDVLAGSVVTVTVAPASRGRVALLFDRDRPNGGWVRVRDGDRSVTFTSCPADEPLFTADGVVGPRTGFPGGLVVAGPHCARFRVHVAGARGTTTVKVPVGKRC